MGSKQRVLEVQVQREDCRQGPADAVSGDIDLLLLARKTVPEDCRSLVAHGRAAHLPRANPHETLNHKP